MILQECVLFSFGMISSYPRALLKVEGSGSKSSSLAHVRSGRSINSHWFSAWVGINSSTLIVGFYMTNYKDSLFFRWEVSHPQYKEWIDPGTNVDFSKDPWDY